MPLESQDKLDESPSLPNDATVDSLGEKLSREGNLFKDTGKGVLNRIEELTENPKELATELGGSFLIGTGLALAQGRAGLPRIAAQAIGSAMSAAFALDTQAQLKYLKSAVTGTWIAADSQNYDANGKLNNTATGNTLGAFLVDGALMSAGGYKGVKLGRNSSVYMGVHQSLDKLNGIATLEQHSRLRTKMMDYHPLTAHHQDRVGGLSRVIAESMGMPPTSVEMAYLAGNMHDIGKIKTPQEILDFPGSLKGHERQVMNHHATETGRILRENVTYPKRLADLPMVAENHHERLDGRGTPNALRKEQIAPETRVNTVADVFDVLSHSRSYKTPTPVEKLVDILESGRDTQFDGKVLDAFYRQKASEVLPYMLADGNQALVRKPHWLGDFKHIKTGDLLHSIKQGTPVEGTGVTTAHIEKFNALYDSSPKVTRFGAHTNQAPTITSIFSAARSPILRQHPAMVTEPTLPFRVLSVNRSLTGIAGG